MTDIEKPFRTFDDKIYGAVNTGGVERMDDSKSHLVQEPEPETGFFVENVRPCIGEFVQVMLFVFIGTMSVQNTGGNIVGIALAHGLCIALLISGFGGISGGHINPAVTVGVTIAGGLKPILFPFYVLAQLLGGILGAALCRGVLGDEIYEAINGGGHTVGTGISDGEAILCEIVVTYILVTTVLMTAVDSDGKNVGAPFAIGLAVLVDILAAGTISGASMNPARSFGPAVVLSSLKSIWGDQWIYWVGPVIGGLVSGGVYRLCFANQSKRISCGR